MLLLWLIHVSTLIYVLAESEEISERKEIVNQLWIDLKDLAEARTQALAGAKEIHTFDRDALDTKERIQVIPTSYSVMLFII